MKLDPGERSGIATEPFRAVAWFGPDALGAMFGGDWHYLLDDALLTWPHDPDAWKTYGAAGEAGKRECDDPTWWRAAVHEIAARLSDPNRLHTIAAVLHIRSAGLVLDNYGGGYHESAAGVELAPHVDFNLHPYRHDITGCGWWRRLNLLLYLNDWHSGDGGELVLGAPDGPQEVIVPGWGTLVAFETTDTSWHAHRPWRRTDRPRRSLAFYAYQVGGVPESVRANPHSTIYWNEEAHGAS